MVPRFYSFATALLVSASSVAFAANYPGNGATGFGGPVGTGSLTVGDTLTSLTFTFNRGAGAWNDDLVLFLDTQSGGFADTSTFDDNGDGGRTAISGANNGNPSRTLATFPSGFGADYAFSVENGFIGVFQLNSGGDNSLGFLFGQSQSGNNSDASYSITLDSSQMAQIGLTAGSGQTVNFVGSYTSTSAYRSNETIGASVSDANDGSGNPGFSGNQTFSNGLSYTLVQAPEPASLGLLSLLGLVAARRRRS